MSILSDLFPNYGLNTFISIVSMSIPFFFGIAVGKLESKYLYDKIHYEDERRIRMLTRENKALKEKLNLYETYKDNIIYKE